MLNYIWLGLIIAGVFVAGLLGNISGAGSISNGVFTFAKDAISLALGLVGGMMLWLGMLRLAEKAGLVNALARLIRPVMSRLFPEVPVEHPAMGAMILNMAANMLGLGNAATPLGLKAMQELDKLNPHKGTATNSMCTFLAINTASITIIPATALIYLAASGIQDPTKILIPSMLATMCSFTMAVIAVKFFQRLPAFRIRETAPEVAPEASVTETSATPAPEAAPETHKVTKAGWIFAGIVTVLMLVVVVMELNPASRDYFLQSSGIQDMLDHQAQLAAGAAELKQSAGAREAVELTGWRANLVSISALIIPLLFVIFTVAAFCKGVRVYEEFIEGAKEGWNVALRIMPFLVAILVAMGIFRTSGALTLLQWTLTPILTLIQFPPELFPLAIMRPLSGSGSLGIVAEILSRPELPDLLKYTAATMYGSTETTFYVLAVYFGSVSIRRTRHALAAGLCADAVGMMSAVIICRIMLG